MGGLMVLRQGEIRVRWDLATQSLCRDHQPAVMLGGDEGQREKNTVYPQICSPPGVTCSLFTVSGYRATFGDETMMGVLISIFTCNSSFPLEALLLFSVTSCAWWERLGLCLPVGSFENVLGDDKSCERKLHWACYSVDEPWQHRAKWGTAVTKDHGFMTPLMWTAQHRQVHRDRRPIQWSPRGWGELWTGSECLIDMEFNFREWWDIWELNRVAQDGEYTKCHSTIHFQMVNLCYVSFTSEMYCKKKKKERKRERRRGRKRKDMTFEGLDFFLWDPRQPSSSNHMGLLALVAELLQKVTAAHAAMCPRVTADHAAMCPRVHPGEWISPFGNFNHANVCTQVSYKALNFWAKCQS